MNEILLHLKISNLKLEVKQITNCLTSIQKNDSKLMERKKCLQKLQLLTYNEKEEIVSLKKTLEKNEKEKNILSERRHLLNKDLLNSISTYKYILNMKKISKFVHFITTK